MGFLKKIKSKSKRISSNWRKNGKHVFNIGILYFFPPCRLCRGREGDGCMEFQERLLRQSLKDFPFANSALLQQLVRQISPVKIVSRVNGHFIVVKMVKNCFVKNNW